MDWSRTLLKTFSATTENRSTEGMSLLRKSEENQRLSAMNILK